MTRTDDFEKAGRALAETKRTSVAQAQCRYDFDIAAEHGYQYAVEKACEWLEAHLLHAEADGYMTTDLFKQFKQFMEE